MKKLLSLILAVTLIVTLTACGSKTETTEAQSGTKASNQTEAPAAPLKGEYVMGTGGVSGTWYPMGGGLCSAMSDGNLNVSVQASAGSLENARLIMSGEREFGLITAAVSYYAYSGTGDFQGEDGSKLRAVCAFAPIEMQILVRADSDIQSVADLAGHSVGLGAAGSADVSTMGELLGVAGLDMEKDIKGDQIALSEQVTAFKDRRLDVAYVFTTAPTSGIKDIASQQSVRLLPINGKLAEDFLTKYPFYCKRTISKDLYTFMKEDVESVGCATQLCCTADLSEDVVYQLCKNLFEHVDVVRAAHSGLAAFSLKDAASGLSIPLHPGAEKYYKEVGIIP